MDKSKINAAKERLKNHKGGENLQLIDNPEMAREYQRRGVEARKKNQARVQALKDFATAIGQDFEVSDSTPSALDILKFCMIKAIHDEDFEIAAQYAEKIAPYESPKLAATQVTEITRNLSDLTDEEFAAKLKELEDSDE